MNQHTIKNPIAIKGIGIHSGKPVTMRLVPANPDTGIVFVRTDYSPEIEIPAVFNNVEHTVMSTDIVTNGATIKTIEHLMSALCSIGIDNLRIELSNQEIPILDGSSKGFIMLIKNAGMQKQHSLRNYLKITKPITVRVDDKFIHLEPADSFVVDVTIDFNHPAIGRSRFCIDFSKQSFEKEIAAARTFGFIQDLEKLRAAGLGLGGSMHNAVILDDYKVLNPDGLRFTNEFVRHKILDAVGDLYTCGFQIIGKYTGYKPGHAINNLLVRSVFEQQAYEIISSKTDNIITPTVDLSRQILYT
jgi:UDP-3-O-[3-hydroxymyristoyl] N-acetylglucosamine deacetylase